MNLARRVTLALFLVGSLAGSHSARGAAVEEVFERARAGDVGHLLEMGERARGSRDRTVEFAVALALYRSRAGSEYESRLVEAFPTTSSEIADVYTRLELRGLAGDFLSWVDDLGDIASRGNGPAVGKMINGAAHSDGAVAEGFAEQLYLLLDERRDLTVATLAQQPPEVKARVYDGLATTSMTRGKVALWLETASDPKTRAVLEEMMTHLGE